MSPAGWSGWVLGWIQRGVLASGTARRCCSPVIWHRRAPRHGRAARPDARPAPVARPGAAMGAVGLEARRRSAGRSSTPRRRHAPLGRCVPARARCLGVKVICTRAVCAFGMNAAGTPTDANRSRRSSPGPARWPQPRGVGSPAAAGKASALASCAGSTTTGSSATTTPPHCRASSSTPGWPGSSLGSGCASSAWPGCPNGCASSCSTGCNSAIRRHHRWIPPRCDLARPPRRRRVAARC
jgi:hypothetical protein